MAYFLHSSFISLSNLKLYFAGFQVTIKRKIGEKYGQNFGKSSEKVGIIGVKM